ncbi:hypothetical protein FK521_30810, partial [Klebsiella pneumoniae]|nr:hypothetical protein [Klebsiella pneumoniae]
GAKAVLKGGGNPLQGILGSLGGLQTAIQEEWKNLAKPQRLWGKPVIAPVITWVPGDRDFFQPAFKRNVTIVTVPPRENGAEKEGDFSASRSD